MSNLLLIVASGFEVKISMEPINKVALTDVFFQPLESGRYYSFLNQVNRAGGKLLLINKMQKMKRCYILSVFWAAKEIVLLYAAQKSAVVQIKWPEGVIIVISPNLLLVADTEHNLLWWDHNTWPSRAYRDPLYRKISQGAVVDWVCFKAF